MGLNINSNFGAIATGALSAMKSSQSLMGKSITRIATGTKFSSHDDPVSLISASKIKADIDGYSALYAGVQNGSARLSVANAAADSMLDILTTMKSKAVAYAALDSANDKAEMSALNGEFSALLTAYSAAAGAYFKGAKVLTGSNLNFTLDINGSTKLSVTMVGQLAAPTGIGNVSAIQNIINSLTASIATMNAGSSALELMSGYLQNMAAAQESAYEAIANADMAAEMTKYVKNNVQAQAAQAMISQANQSMAQVLNLLQ